MKYFAVNVYGTKVNCHCGPYPFKDKLHSKQHVIVVDMKTGEKQICLFDMIINLS